MSPTQRSLAHLRELGFHCEIVTYWNHFSKRRVDLLGIADILAFRPEVPEVLLVQATDDSDHAKRRTKILASENARKWLACDDGKTLVRRIVIHSWGKRGARGEKKTWTLRTEYITADQYELVEES